MSIGCARSIAPAPAGCFTARGRSPKRGSSLAARRRPPAYHRRSPTARSSATSGCRCPTACVRSPTSTCPWGPASRAPSRRSSSACPTARPRPAVRCRRTGSALGPSGLRLRDPRRPPTLGLGGRQRTIRQRGWRRLGDARLSGGSAPVRQRHRHDRRVPLRLHAVRRSRLRPSQPQAHRAGTTRQPTSTPHEPTTTTASA